MKDYYIGIDLGGTNIKSSIYTKDYKSIGENRTETKANHDSKIVLQRMLENIDKLLANTHIDKD